MSIKLTPENFLKLYVIHPLSRDLSPTDQKIALVASIALGVVLLGTYHLFLYAAEKCKNFREFCFSGPSIPEESRPVQAVFQDVIVENEPIAPPPSPAAEEPLSNFDKLSLKQTAYFFKIVSKSEFSSKEAQFIKFVHKAALDAFPMVLQKAKDMFLELKEIGLFSSAKVNGAALIVDRSEFEVAKIKFVRENSAYMRMIYIFSKPHYHKILKTLCGGGIEGAVKKNYGYRFFPVPSVREDCFETSLADFKTLLLKDYRYYKGRICFYKSLFFVECDKKMIYADDFYKILRILISSEAEPEMDLQKGVVKASYNQLNMAFYLTRFLFESLIPFALTEDMQLAIARFTAAILVGESKIENLLLLDKPITFQVSNIEVDESYNDIILKSPNRYLNLDASSKNYAKRFVDTFITYQEVDLEFTIENQNAACRKKSPFPFKQLKEYLLSVIQNHPENALSAHAELKKSPLIASLNLPEEGVSSLMTHFFRDHMDQMSGSICELGVAQNDLKEEVEPEFLRFINEFIQMKCFEVVMITLANHAQILKDDYKDLDLPLMQMHSLGCTIFSENQFKLNVNHYFFYVNSHNYIPAVSVDASINVCRSKIRFNPFENILFSPLVSEEKFRFLWGDLSGNECENIKNYYLCQYLSNLQKIFKFASDIPIDTQLEDEDINDLLALLSKIATQKVFLNKSWEQELQKAEALLKEKLLIVLELLRNQVDVNSQIDKLITAVDNKITKSYKL